jgi:cytochrome d ubiquinol oxidase subunit II
MGHLWFLLVALMLTVYVVLDGFDLGAGIIHLFIAGTDEERRQVLRSIGPVWDGNEVWLLATGGTLYFAFPALYAASFSGFYLPLMIVLWLLILRGISIEFRSHVEGAIWTGFWDVVFSLASLLLAVFYGAALGNVVRGVPLDAHGRFFEPLWTNFRLGPDTGILDWYTILVGIFALLVLTLHGSLWVALKTENVLNQRSRQVARAAWWGVAAFTVIVTVFTFRVQPEVGVSLAAHPWGYIFPAFALAGLLGIAWFLKQKNDTRAFFSSCAYIVGMLASVALGLHPYLLPASTNPAFALTVENSQAQPYGLRIGLIWWLIGMTLAIAYSAYTYRSFAGKVSPSREEGY